MKTLKSKKEELAELQEAFAVMVQELDEAYSKTQELLRKFKRAKPDTEAYSDAWAELYVALNVVETKARTVQEILDEIDDSQNDD